MAVISGDFPPGPYTVTYKATDIGLMEGPIRTQQSWIGLPIRASLWGQHILDYIIQGASHFIVLVVKEWDAGAKAAMWPLNASHGIVPKAGLLANQFFGALVLTALTGTPAATEGPVTRTYNLAALMPGHNLDITFGPVERNVPLVFAVLPEQDGATTGQAIYLTDT